MKFSGALVAFVVLSIVALCSMWGRAQAPKPVAPLQQPVNIGMNLTPGQLTIYAPAGAVSVHPHPMMPSQTVIEIKLPVAK